MKTILYFSFVLAGFVSISGAALGQSKFTLSATVAPFYEHAKSSQVLIIPTPSGGNYDTRVKSKMSGQGYWAGLNVGYTFSSKLSASTGLWFSHVNQNKPTIVSSPTVLILSGKGKSHNFLVPVQLNYQTSSGKLSPYFSAGALFNFKSVTTVDILEGISGDIINKRMKIAPMVGAGIIYHFAEHFSLVAQPTFSYTATGMDAGSHAYRVSFNAQVLYKF